jgi:hypothetical protein
MLYALNGIERHEKNLPFNVANPLQMIILVKIVRIIFVLFSATLTPVMVVISIQMGEFPYNVLSTWSILIGFYFVSCTTRPPPPLSEARAASKAA